MIYIHGTGHFHPDNIIDNKFLEELDIGTSNEWILERVGIKSRRTVLPLDYLRTTRNQDPKLAHEASLFTNAQTAARAAEMALGRASLSAKDIGMVISGSCTPQNVCPAEACTIAMECEIEAPAFDINSACSSLGAQINLINKMDKNSLPDFILLTHPENNTRSIDYNDRSSAVLWGDCSSALVLSTKIPSPFVVTETSFQSSPKNWRKVGFPVGGHFRQDGRTVQTFAIKRSLSLIREMRKYIPGENVDKVKVIGHQANLMMLNSVCNLAEIKKENHLYNVDMFGNCGAAGAASVLSQNWENFSPGDFITLTIVGAGLSWAALLIEVRS